MAGEGELGVEGVASEGGGDDSDSLFNDEAKRTKILGGVSKAAQDSPASLFGFDAAFASSGGGWGGSMGGMGAGVVGPKWATAPLGAFTYFLPLPPPSPSPSLLRPHVHSFFFCLSLPTPPRTAQSTRERALGCQSPWALTYGVFLSLSATLLAP